MRSTDISITVNGEPFLWPQGFDALSLDQQVVVKNYSRFALKSLEKRRSERKPATPKGDSSATRVKRIELKKPIEQFLEETAQEIKTYGPLTFSKRRKSQKRCGLWKSSSVVSCWVRATSPIHQNIGGLHVEDEPP
jgi:hypothetical protein